MPQQELKRRVTVAGATYGPGDDVPADVAEKITNPKAWVPVDEDDTTNGDANPDAGTTSGHRLATTVTIGGRSYGPDDHIPDDVADQIRNPKAWEGYLVLMCPEESSAADEELQNNIRSDVRHVRKIVAGGGRTPRQVSGPLHSRPDDR